MFTVTDTALRHLHEALSQADPIAESDTCFRMTISDNNTVGLKLESPASSDQTFGCEGSTVLAAPKPLLDLLTERVLDLDGQGQLVLVPKAV